MNSSFSASHLILGAIALVIGLVLGGMGPRSEARSLRAELAAMEAKDCSQSRNGVGDRIVDAFRAPARQRVVSDPAPAGEEAPAAPLGAPAEPESDDGAGSAEVVTPGEEGTSREERFDVMADTMDMRRAQSRQALREQTGASAEQMDTMDGVIDAMNQDLAALAEDMVSTMDDQGELLSRRATMLFARDALDVMIDTDSQLRATLNPDQMEGVDTEVLDPLSHVDGSVVEVLAEYEGP